MSAVGSLSKSQGKKRARDEEPHVNSFIDMEALETEAEELEDELEGDAESIIDDDEYEDAGDSMASHALLTNAFNQNESEVDLLWHSFVHRARQRSQNPTFTNVDQLSPEFREFCEDDNPLWEVPCKVGFEEVAVFNIMKWSLHDEIPTIGGISAIGRATLPGRVLVEAPTLEAAKKITAHVSYLFPNKTKPLSRDSYLSCLTEGNTYSPMLHHWVRLRRPKLYKGDVGLIIRVDEALLIDVAVIPRISFISDRVSNADRPPQKLIKLPEVERFLGAGSIRAINSLLFFTDERYCDERYCESGQRILRYLDTDSYIPAEAMPTISELEMFQASHDVPQEALTKTLDRITLESLRVGDQVKVLAGEYQGLLGEVEAISDLVVQVAIPSQGVSQEILMHYLRRNFQIGDEVRIAVGPDSGFVGWVTVVDSATEPDPTICLYNTSLEKEVKVSHSSAKFYSPPFVWTTIRPIPPPRINYTILKTINKKRQKADPEEGRQVRIDENPNRRYEGKKVGVVQGNFKGYHGRIKFTTPQGEARVELDATAVSTMRIESFPLSHLHVLRDDILSGPLSGHHDVSQLTVPTLKTPVMEEAEPSTNVCSTPLPSLEDIPGSPSWDPSSGTPRAEQDETPQEAVPYWLADETFKAFKFTLKVYDPLQQYEKGIYHSKWVRFLSAIGGSVAKVAVGFKTVDIPFQYLLPVHPTTDGELVVPISGEFRGQLMRVVNYNDGRCALKDPKLPVPRRKGYRPPVVQSDQLALVTGMT